MSGLRIQAIVLMAPWLFLCGASVSCTEEGMPEQHNDADRAMQTRNVLDALTLEVRGAEVKSNRYPPTEPQAFGKWIRDYSEVASSDLEMALLRYDRHTGLFLDAWQRPVVLVVRSESLVGLGSCGPNGRWENGLNDDIVLWFSEKHIPSGPAGERVDADRDTGGDK